jgi:alpha-glucuronidase
MDNILEGYGYGKDVEGQDQSEFTTLSPAKKIIVDRTAKGESTAKELNAKVTGEFGVKEDNDYEGYGCQEK